MRSIIPMLRLMTHINIGAAIALAVWLIASTPSTPPVEGQRTTATGQGGSR